MYHLTNRMFETAKIEGVDVSKDLQIEYLPASGVERTVALDRIRTEMMSGDGPDLFIIVCSDKRPESPDEALFPIPEKLMELGLFLPLDVYIEQHTVFAEWDRMNQTILAAGRTKEGQQIVPLCYTLPVTVYRAEDVEHTASKEVTWTDMLKNEDKALKASAVWTDNSGVQKQGMPFLLHRAPMTEFLLGGIADYRAEELLFTEEELGMRLSEIVQLGIEYSEGKFEDTPKHYNTYAGYSFTNPYVGVVDINGNMLDVLNGIDYREEHTLIPLYSDDGGVTAEITAYAAINRNSELPEDAYRILDYLMSYNVQRSNWLYENILYLVGDTTSVPMYDELMSEDQRVYQDLLGMDGSQKGWYMPDANFAQLCNIRKQITNVKFRNALDQEFSALYRKYLEAVQNGDDVDRIVSEGYRIIQQMVRE